MVVECVAAVAVNCALPDYPFRIADVDATENLNTQIRQYHSCLKMIISYGQENHSREINLCINIVLAFSSHVRYIAIIFMRNFI